MVEWFEGDVLANRIRVHYHRTGDEKPQVVLCHGFSDNGLCWSALARELETDYDVVMVDARYHGLSEAPREGGGSAAMAADLAGVIDALELDRPVAMGHSMGAAYVAYAAAESPDLLRGIVLEDPPGWRVSEPDVGTQSERREWMESRRAEMTRRARMTLVELVAECHEIHPSWDEETCRLFMIAKKQLSPMILDRGVLHRRPWREVLKQIRCPILLLTGDTEKGAIVTSQAAEEGQRLSSLVQHVHVPGVGHHIRYESPEPYNRAVTRFLARVYAS